MKKAVLLSIRPDWIIKIGQQVGERNGTPVYQKTIEVRKTRPKLETPFKCYIYETRRKEKSYVSTTVDGVKTKVVFQFDGCGKVIGEFVCDKVYDIKAYAEFYGTHYGWTFDFALSDTCLSENEFEKYLSKKSEHYLKPLSGYGWHISELKIYDVPKELGEFRKENSNCFDKPCQYCKFYHEEKDGLFDCDNIITRPPQSWRYVEELDN